MATYGYCLLNAIFLLQGCLCCNPVPDAVYLPVPEASCTFWNHTTCGYIAMSLWQSTEGQSFSNQSATTPVLFTTGQDDQFYMLFRPVNNTNTSVTITSPTQPAGQYQITFWYAMPGQIGLLGLKTIEPSTNATTNHWNRTNILQKNWTHENINLTEADNFTIAFGAYEEDFGFVGLDNIEVCRACDTLQIDHGKVTYNEVTAEFHCDDGYVLIGSSNVTCSQWKWDANASICQPVDCGPLKAPDHGAVTTINNTFGSVATISCGHGHLLVGEKTSKCEANGKWNFTGHTCTFIDCGTLTVPVHGKVSSNESVLGTKVTIICDTGYVLNGSNTSECEATGSWSSTCHMCVPADGSPDQPGIIRRTCIYDCSFTNNNSCGYTFGDSWKVWNGEFPFSSRTLRNNGDDDFFALFEPPFCEKNISLPYTYSQLLPAGAACLSFYVQFFYILPGSMATLHIRTRTQDNVTAEIRNVTGARMTSWTNIQCLVIEEQNPYTVDFFAESINHALIGIDDIRVESLYCGIGYRPVSVEVDAYCNKSRAELPACEAIDCGMPIAPLHGNVSSFSTTYGSTAKITCSTGYNLTGSSTTTCFNNSKWSNTDQTCIIIDCGSLPALSDGTIVYTVNTTFGSIAVLTCDEGFNLTGDSVSECTSSGIWNSTGQTCNPIDCGSPPTLMNGTVYASNTTVGSVAIFTCVEGLGLNGSKFSVCSSSGVWNSTNQSCHTIDCGLLPVLINGSIVYTENTTFRSIAILACDEGYYLTGKNYSECTSSGNWEFTNQKCYPLDCGPLSASHNAYLTSTVTTYGTVSKIKCKTGYLFHGNDTTYCDSDGHWTNTNFTCTIVDCGPLTPNEHEYIVYIRNTSTFDSPAIMVCESGYRIKNSRISVTARCKSDGNWSITQDGTCEPVDCGLLPALMNGTIVYTGNTTWRSIANLTCDEGFYLTGEHYSECHSSGNWIFTNQMCNPLDCGPLSASTNANLTSKVTTYGTVSKITCNTGYLFNGNDTTYCDSDGNWTNTNFTCTIVDCGTLNPRKYQHISYIGNTTTYDSRAIMVCELGYSINSAGLNSQVAACNASGNWSIANFSTCKPTVCPSFNLSDGVEMDHEIQAPFKVNTSISFKCKTRLTLIGYINIRCLPSGEWSGTPPNCTEENIKYTNCPHNVDYSKRDWSETSPGGIRTQPCHDDSFIGVIFRRCSTKGEWLLPVDGCVRKEIEIISAQVEAIRLNPTVKSIAESLNKLSTVTNIPQTEQGSTFLKTTSGELQKITNILDTIVNASEDIKEVTEIQYKPFLNTTSNLLDASNTDSWKSIAQTNGNEDNHMAGAVKVLHVVGRYIEVISNSTKNDSITVNSTNLVMHVRRIDGNSLGIQFPVINHEAIKSSVVLPKASITKSSSFSAVVYRNLSGILSSNTGDRNSHAEISSEVVAVTLDNWHENEHFNISLTLGYFPASSGQPQCTFWNTSRSAWDSSGCNLTSNSGNSSTCVCNHLTNFAILMSPWTENVDTLALDVISIVGCSVSMLGLIITVAVHVYLWRYVKSDRVVILMNLSVALIVSYAVFVGGVDRTENKSFCTTMAVLLHYIYLVVFFLMLAEGIEIGITLLYVFVTTSRLKWILPAAWALPAVIVGISMGATQLVGYGNERNCWLSIEGGLIWAFVAPATLVILVNIVLLILVIQTMLRTKTLSEKSRTERSKAGVRCLCVLLPLMGCTWVIGLLYVNEGMAWVQYVFAVCNSLQGLVIFVFHCVLNVQIRNALQKQKRKKNSQSFLSTNSASFVSTRVSEDTVALPRINLSQDANRRSF